MGQNNAWEVGEVIYVHLTYPSTSTDVKRIPHGNYRPFGDNISASSSVDNRPTPLLLRGGRELDLAEYSE